MNNIIVEIYHGEVKYDNIEIYDELKEMVEYLKMQSNIELKKKWKGEKYCPGYEILLISEPYIKERIFLWKKPHVDKILIGEIWFSNYTKKAKIDELVVFESESFESLKLMKKLAEDFAEQFQIKVKITIKH